jgi:hypothetical protein
MPASFRRLVKERTDLEIKRLETRNISPEVIQWAWGALAPIRNRVARRRSAPTPVPQTANGSVESPAVAMNDGVRSRVESSRALRAAKWAANVALNATVAGEGIFAVLRKREA